MVGNRTKSGRLLLRLAFALVGVVALWCSSNRARADATPPQPVEALWSSPLHVDLFVVNKAGEISSAWWEQGCGWQPWFAIHPETATAAAGQPVTAAWTNNNTHLDLFVTGRDGRIMSTWWEAAKSWQPWFAIHPETATAAAGQPVTAAWTNNNTHLDLFVTGRDGRIMSTWWEASKSWQPWFAIHPETATAAAGQPVTAVWTNNNKHLDLFVTARDGRIMSTWWEAAKSWQPWFAIHPETATAAAGQPVTAAWTNNNTHLDLFVTGRDGRIMSTWWEAAKSWQPWFAIHPETATAAAGQPVTAVWTNNNKHLDLFVTARDGRIMSTWWEAAKSWQPWFAIHPETATAAPGQTVTAVWTNNNTHLDLFVTGRDGRIMSTWWEAAKSWQPWFAIFADAPTLRDPRNVVTELNDRARTGLYPQETQLTLAAVQSVRFGKRAQWPVEGQMLAQPLYVRNVPVAGARRNLVVAATAANLIYAFDADRLEDDAPVFKVQLGASNELLDPGNPTNRPPFHTKVSVCDETFPHFIGITSTPVVDDLAGVMYIVDYDTAHDQHVLHALDINHNFAEARPPVVIAAPGFDPYFVRNRPALILMNEVVYVAFASFICDNPQPFSGWVFGYRTADLTQVSSWQAAVPSPQGGGGIWQSGRGLVGAPDGSLYFETGNDASFPPAAQSLANSFVKLRTSCSGAGLTLDKSFTPQNSAILSIGDTDLGSSGPLLLPGNRLIGGGKQGRAYVLDAATLAPTQNAMGPDGFEGFQAFVNTYHSDPSKSACPKLNDAWCKAPANLTPTTWKDVEPLFGSDCFYPTSCYQITQGLGPNIHAGFVYWPGATPDGGLLYALAEKEYLRAFRYHLSSGHVDETPALTATGVRAPDGMPGGAISISANGDRDGILWVTMSADLNSDAAFGVHPGRLIAVDATNLNVLFRDDSVPAFAKFNPPTIADGKVFLPTFALPDAAHPAGLGWLIVYGLQ